MTPVVRLVDDDEELLAAFSFVLRVAGFDVVRYASAEAFLEGDAPERPGCVVLDVRMAGMNGLECQAELNRRGCDLPVLFMSGHGDVGIAMQAVKQGAADFLQKPVEAEDLVAACRRLCEWHEKEREKEREKAKELGKLATLTAREREVAELVAEGLPNKVIADELGVSEQGVKYHRANVCRKLGVRTAVEISRLLKACGASPAADGLITVKVLP